MAVPCRTASSTLIRLRQPGSMVKPIFSQGDKGSALTQHPMGGNVFWRGLAVPQPDDREVIFEQLRNTDDLKQGNKPRLG